MKKRNIVPVIIGFILLFALPLTLFLMNLFREDTTQLAKIEFSQYYDGKNNVAISLWDKLYFEEYVLKNEDFHPDHCTTSNLVFDGKIYFAAFSKIENNIRKMNIYSCDLTGENKNLVYSKEYFTDRQIEIQTQEDSYYIKYENSDIVFIDQYCVSTNEYKNLSSGEGVTLSDLISNNQTCEKYSLELVEDEQEKRRGRFVITDLETNEVRVINDDYLKNTKYIDSMQKFGYSPMRCDLSNGHILLTYSIGAGDGWNYSHLVFEYEFDENEIEYKLLAFPNEMTPVFLLYAETT